MSEKPLGRGQDLAGVLAGFTLFADLSRPQLEAATHTFEELWFTEGQRILRQGFSQPDFFVIIEGEAAVRIGGEERARLSRGDFFGEISVLLGDVPSADVVAITSLRCLRLSGDQVHRFLTMFPAVMYRMLEAVAGRLRDTLQWQT
jgi:CRP-like cAMP-binding protein